MNDTTQHQLDVTVPLIDLDERFKAFFKGGYPFDDPDSQGWKLGYSPIETDSGTERLLVLANEKMGLYRVVGVTQAGYVVPANYEPGGGGALTMPYSVVRNEAGQVVDIEVAFRIENRPFWVSDSDQPTNIGLLAGFQDPGESPELTAHREHIEESGGVRPGQIEKASVRGSGANRAFDILLGEDDGLKAFAYEMTDAKRAEFSEQDGIVILSYKAARVRSRDQIIKGALFDLICYVGDNYEMALA